MFYLTCHCLLDGKFSLLNFDKKIFLSYQYIDMPLNHRLELQRTLCQIRTQLCNNQYLDLLDLHDVGEGKSSMACVLWSYMLPYLCKMRHHKDLGISCVRSKGLVRKLVGQSIANHFGIHLEEHNHVEHLQRFLRDICMCGYLAYSHSAC